MTIEGAYVLVDGCPDGAPFARLCAGYEEAKRAGSFRLIRVTHDDTRGARQVGPAPDPLAPETTPMSRAEFLELAPHAVFVVVWAETDWTQALADDPAPTRARLMAANRPELRAMFGRRRMVYFDPDDAEPIGAALMRAYITRIEWIVPPRPADPPRRPLRRLADALFSRDTGMPPRKPLYFLHIGKTAGTSIRAVLEDQFDASDICPLYHTGQLQIATDADIRGYKLYRGHMGLYLLDRLRTPIDTFTWLRDPMKTLYSAYFYNKGQRNIPKTMTLDEWVPTRGDDRMCREICDTIDMEGEARPDDACAALHTMRMVGLVERQEDSMSLLCHTFDLFPPMQPVVMNKGPRKPPQLPPSTLDLAAYTAGDARLYEVGARLFHEEFEKMVRALGFPAEALQSEDPAILTGQIRETLRRNFFTRHAGRLSSHGCEYRFDQPLIGEGWSYREEGKNGVCWRWIEAGSQGILYLPVRIPRTQTLWIGLAHAPSAEVVSTLRLEVNDRPAPIERDDRRRLPGVTTCAVLKARLGPISVDAARPFLKIALIPSMSYCPADVDPTSTDRRQLTVAVNAIDIG